MATLAVESERWIDTEAYAQDIRDRFVANVDGDAELEAHRDFIEKHVYGFGERAFHWLWKLLIDEMPESFSFLEVGVYKGQILSLVRLLADCGGKQADIYGVTLLSSFGGDDTTFPDEDYRAHIDTLHVQFGQSMPNLIVGDSTDVDVHAKVRRLAPFDLIYVDGCHDYDYVLKDLLFYPGMVERGGYLVVDDCACDLKQPWGFFQGIRTVCDAVKVTILLDPTWEHVLTVIHDRLWRKV